MKKLISAFLCLVVLFALAFPVHAANSENVVMTRETTLDNGITVMDEVTVYCDSRATERTATRKNTFKDGDTVIGIVTIQATFRYDGSTVSVVSKSVTQVETYEGWNYVQNSFISSGGSVVLSAKLTKWLVLNTPFTITLSCDKNGNIS